MTMPACQPRWLEAAVSLAIEILSFFLSLSNRNERPFLFHFFISLSLSLFICIVSFFHTCILFLSHSLKVVIV